MYQLRYMSMKPCNDDGDDDDEEGGHQVTYRYPLSLLSPFLPMHQIAPYACCPAA